MWMQCLVSVALLLNMYMVCLKRVKKKIIIKGMEKESRRISVTSSQAHNVAQSPGIERTHTTHEDFFCLRINPR